MGNGSRFITCVSAYTFVWVSYEMYYQMRVQEFLSLAAIGYAALSVGCVVVGTLIAKTALDS